MKIKRGDKILVKKGKDRGKTGVIQKVLPKINKVIVSGLNVYKKSLKKSQKNPQGGIVDLNVPMASANVMLICPRCNKATKIVYKLTDKEKFRICKKCQETVEIK